MLQKVYASTNSSLPRWTIALLYQLRQKHLYESCEMSNWGRFASAKRFCSFWGPHPLRNRSFSWNFIMWDVPRVQPCKPWSLSNFFLGLCMELSFCMHQGMHLLWDRKLVPSIFFWFFQPKFRLFQKNSPTKFMPQLTQVCPAGQ